MVDDIEIEINLIFARSGSVELQQMKKQVATEFEEIQNILDRHEEIRSYERT